MAPRAHWGWRLGNASETGYSEHVAPSDLPGMPPAWAHSASSMTPLIDEQCNVYVNTIYRTLEKLSPDGLQLWEHAVEGSDDGVASNPALADGVVYFATVKGMAYALGTQTGEVKWKRKYCSSSTADGWAVGARGKAVIMAGHAPETPAEGQNDTVFALDAATGKELWAFRVQIMLLLFTPTVLENCVIFLSQVANVECLNLRDGSVRWQFKDLGPGTTGGVGVSERLGMVFAASNRRSRRAWNKPFGGKGALRALRLKDGSKAWEQEFDLEANGIPTVAPVGPGGRSLVLLGLGASPGVPEPPEANTGDTWPSLIIAFDATSGEQVWMFKMITHRGPPAGWTPVNKLRCNAWTPLVCGGDGSVYVGSMSGLLLILDGATGKRKHSCIFAEAITSAPAIGPGMLAAVASCNGGPELLCWRFKQVAPGQVLLPLDKPLSETGTEHFWPCKQGANLAHPCVSQYSAPTHLDPGPTWTFQFKNPKLYPWYKRPIGDFTHKTPIIDCQGNIYIETHQSPLWIVRPDGRLRGFLRLGPCLANPAIDGRHLYVSNGPGWAFCVDLETLAVKWSTKYAKNGTPDSWNVTVARGLALFMGDNNPPTRLSALSTETGEVRWRYELTEPVYNFLPSVLAEEDRFIFCDSGGGIFCLQLSSGKEIWKNLEAENKPCFSTGYCVSAPNGLIYNCWNKGPAWVHVAGKGKPMGGVGLVRGYEIQTGAIRWTREFDLEANNAALPVAKPDGGWILVVPLGANASDNTKEHGDEWVGRLLGLDGETGDDVWSWDPPLWKWPGAKGPRTDVDGEYYNPDSWSNPPVLGANGVCYCQWHDGTIYAFNPITGEKISSWTLPDCGESGIPVIAPGILACPGGFGLKVFRDRKLEAEWREAASAKGDPRALVDFGETAAEAFPGETLQPATSAEALADCWGAVNRGCEFSVEVTEEGFDSFAEASFQEWQKSVAEEKAAADAKAAEKAKAAGKAPPEAKATAPGAPAAKAKAAAANPVAPAEREIEGPVWTVVGGGASGGIMVKMGRDLKSTELGRLSTGAQVEQTEDLQGERLHYRKISGDGPDFGWVSLTFKGKELLKRA